MLAEKADKFWNSDLEEVERCFLKGKKITDLPIRSPDSRAPHQGSVLLDRAINIDSIVRKPNIATRLFVRLFR